MGISSVLMLMKDQIKITMTDHVSRYFKDFDNNNKKYVSIENLLMHNSGLQANLNTVPKNATELLHNINNLKL